MPIFPPEIRSYALFCSSGEITLLACESAEIDGLIAIYVLLSSFTSGCILQSYIVPLLISAVMLIELEAFEAALISVEFIITNLASSTPKSRQKTKNISAMRLYIKTPLPYYWQRCNFLFKNKSVSVSCFTA